MELRFENVTKRYGKKTALDSFSVTLTEGIHALLGPNGAGKSTLMNILAGLLAQTSGVVYLDGRDICTMGADYRSILGFMPQDCGFYPSFTAQQTLEYFAVLREVENSRERIDRMFELVGLQEDRNRKVGGFSGGMKRRLGIALALLNDPKILILDEPTARLDPKERMRFRTALSRLSRDKIVLLATHIVSDVESISDSCLLLRQGRLTAYGTPDELCYEIEGKVWELKADDDLTMLENARLVKHPEGEYIRIVTEQKPVPEAQSVTAGLEDVYMYYFGEGSENADKM